MTPEQQLLRSWEANAGAWTAAVRGRAIPSRAAGTDLAIVEAVQALHPARVLDVGCGEGWLARRLRTELGCAVVGIDGSAPLIAAAEAADPHGSYRVLSYQTACADPRRLGGPHDVVVCNFALLGERLAPLLGALASALAPGGAVLIQTLHPWAACGEQPYRDGWREETFAAFGAGSWQPMPWYFRTLDSWLAEIRAAGLALAACREPPDPASGRPLSLLLQLVRSPGTRR
jgi:2-polyprenyl-3-methyl-5-hydroxy-6-metoxy-1,4-benzoquinol methylase